MKPLCPGRADIIVLGTSSMGAPALAYEASYLLNGQNHGAGSTRWWKNMGQVLTPEESYMPEVGNSFTLMQKKYISTSPAKKFGMADPINDSPEEI